MIIPSQKCIAVVDGAWVDRQWNALFVRGSSAVDHDPDETESSPPSWEANEFQPSIEKLLAARWDQPWAAGIGKTINDGLAQGALNCWHEVAVCTLGNWLMSCADGNTAGPSVARAMEECYGGFARKCRMPLEDWGTFSRDLWLLTALAHDRCLVLEKHLRERRLLAKAYPVMGHVYKGKIRTNHIWKSLRGSLFMRRVGKERLFAGLKHHSRNLHGFLTALDLLIPHRKELRTQAGLALQAVACAVATYNEENLSFSTDPLAYWLALIHGIFRMVEPGRSLTDDGHPLVVELAGSTLRVTFPPFQVLRKRLGSASGLQDKAEALKSRMEGRDGPFHSLSFQFKSMD